VLVGLLQGPGTRLTYRVRVMERTPTGTEVLATGSVSGSLDTDLRFGLRSDSAEVEILFQIDAGGSDTVSLGADFFTKRRLSRSRRGLPLWELDAYRRASRIAWGDTARIHLFGPPRPEAARALWIELVLERVFTGGETRAGEELLVVDPTQEIQLEAVVRPRRARVILNLVRGDTVSGPRPLDLAPDAPARQVRLVIGPRPLTFTVSLVRPDVPRAGRDRALALDADVVCLRVIAADPAQPVGVLCGRLNNVARRLPLPGGDTLVATFAWPVGR
jgi:hypothetical protein